MSSAAAAMEGGDGVTGNAVGHRDRYPGQPVGVGPGSEQSWDPTIAITVGCRRGKGALEALNTAACVLGGGLVVERSIRGVWRGESRGGVETTHLGFASDPAQSRRRLAERR